MLPTERYAQIIRHLGIRNYIKTKDLAQLLEVTEPTMRADLAYLETQGKLIKIRGGATLVSSKGSDLSLSVRGETMVKEKISIGRKVVDYIPDGTSIFMDASTTVLKVAQLLSIDKHKRLTIITNFLDIVNVLLPNKNMRVIFCGGNIDSENRYATGEETVRTTSSYHADIALLGCHGISLEKGFFNGSVEATSIKKEMIQNSEKTWICADHTKFDRVGLVKFLNFSDVDILFTDSIPEEWYSKNKQLPLKIVAVHEPSKTNQKISVV